MPGLFYAWQRIGCTPFHPGRLQLKCLMKAPRMADFYRYDLSEVTARSRVACNTSEILHHDPAFGL
jgi:hypothetical protein